MHTFQSEMHNELGAVRSEQGALRSELEGLRSDMYRESATLRADMATQTRSILQAVVFSTVGSVAAVGALAFAAARLV